MFVSQEKKSFERIGKLIKNIDTTSGVFLLKDSTKKKTIKEHIFESTMPRFLIFAAFMVISTLIVTDFALISIIFCGALITFIIGLYVSLFIYLTNKKVVEDLLKWCENIYDVEKKYHKFIRNVAETNLMVIERQSTKFLKYGRIIFYMDGFGGTLGFAIVGLFLPENIYPKFSPPLPFYLPFKNQNTWISFCCTTLFQTLIVADITTIAIFVFGILFVIFIHILGYLDTIQQVAEKMKQDVICNTKKYKISRKSISTLNMQTLADVNAGLMENNSLSFEEWIEMLNDMICDVNSVIIIAEKLFSISFLLNEVASFGSLFICGLLFTVVHQQYFYAIGVTIVSWLLFIICFINEKILEKIENINKTLYDIPWYYLTVSQRKSLMMLMHCDKIQNGLKAGRIHNLTFERFGIVVKAGYTNMLILKDLVQK